MAISCVNRAGTGICDLSAGTSDESKRFECIGSSGHTREHRLLERHVIGRAGDHPGLDRIEANPNTVLRFHGTDLERHACQLRVAHTRELLRGRKIRGDESFFQRDQRGEDGRPCAILFTPCESSGAFAITILRSIPVKVTGYITDAVRVNGIAWKAFRMRRSVVRC